MTTALAALLSVVSAAIGSVTHAHYTGGVDAYTSSLLYRRFTEVRPLGTDGALEASCVIENASHRDALPELDVTLVVFDRRNRSAELTEIRPVPGQRSDANVTVALTGSADQRNTVAFRVAPIPKADWVELVARVRGVSRQDAEVECAVRGHDREIHSAAVISPPWGWALLDAVGPLGLAALWVATAGAFAATLYLGHRRYRHSTEPAPASSSSSEPQPTPAPQADPAPTAALPAEPAPTAALPPNPEPAAASPVEPAPAGADAKGKAKKGRGSRR